MKLAFLLIMLCMLASVSYSQEAAPSPQGNVGTSTLCPGYENLPAARTFSDLKLTKSSVYVRPDASTRRKRFINASVGPIALGRMVATAGISTWKNSPEEWGTKWEGFGRRVASNIGKNAIKQTTKFGLDEALKYDSQFYRSDKYMPFRTRLTRALLSPVTAKNKNGTRVVGVPNLVGTYASSVIAYETWYPKRYDWKDGFKSGTLSLGFNAAFNVFKEFVWRKK